MLFNEFLAPQCLVICSKTLNYFLTSTYDLNQKSKSAPSILLIQRHRVSNVIATVTNPRQIGLTDRDLGLTEMGLQTLCFPFVTFRSHRKSESVPPRLQCKFSVSFFVTFRSHRKSKSVPPSLPDQLSG